MKAFREGLSVVVVCALIASRLGAEEAKPESLPPSKIPEAYKDYEFLDDSLSPDKRLAFLNPKREIYLEAENYKGHLYLASLSPFKIVATFPGDFFLVRGNHAEYSYEWAQDGSAALVTQDAKWGVNKVFVVTAADGKIVDLTAKVRQLVQKDFEASKAERYNDYYDFIFTEEDRTESGWKFDGKGRVIIDCTCTTDPKEIIKNRWMARFKGVWDIGKATLKEVKWARVQ